MSQCADVQIIATSRELRAVMEQILHQDPAMTPGPAAPLIPRHQTGAPRGNLPLRSTSFVGRSSELQPTVELLGASRLVTLAGPGGAGKTALGIEAARASAGRFSDGAVFVRLAAVTEHDLLAHAVADALAVNIEGGTADGSAAEYDTLVWATGFAADHTWIDIPDVTDERGRILHTRGVTPSPGLYMLGLTWQHTRGSALFGAAAADRGWPTGRRPGLPPCSRPFR